MANPLQGKWEITAQAPIIGALKMIATMNVSADEKSFEGEVYVEKLRQTIPLRDGKLDGNKISYGITMKIVGLPMDFNMEGTFNEADWTCEGSAKTNMMSCSYTGKKIFEEQN